MNFCSNCANILKFRLPDGDHLPRFICDQCGIIHYQNPRIIVGCLCIWEDKVLLCKRAIEPRAGYWNIPAGFMENEETIEKGAMREAYEEAGVECELIGLHTVFTIPKVNQVHVHFLTQMVTPDFYTTPESSEVVLFEEAEIPWDELAFASSVFSLKKYFQDRKKGFHGTHLGSFDPGVFSAWLQ